MRQWTRLQIARRPMLSFVVINYALSWAFLYPSYQILLGAHGSIPPLALLGLIGAYGPSIAAIVVLAASEGRRGVRTALAPFVVWRVGPRWYAYVLTLPFGAYALAALVHARPHLDLGSGLRTIPGAWLVALPFGPLGEELGWRGFMLPRLLRRFGAVAATVIVGLTWAAWHLASFTFPGAAIPSVFAVTASSIGLFACQLIAEAGIFTYVWIKTPGSLILAVLLHMSFNANTNILEGFFPASSMTDEVRRQTYYTYVAILVVWAIATFVFDRGLRSGRIASASSGTI
jgi:membrane protease YdiL (CAAX protease family)